MMCDDDDDDDDLNELMWFAQADEELLLPFALT
jgi:hypothetical protein